MDSNTVKSGVWEMRLRPRDGGSHINVVNDRRFKGKGRVLAVARVLIGRSVLKKDLEKSLDILREQSRS
jgi:hypothetical protein